MELACLHSEPSWKKGRYSSHLHIKHDFLVPPALRQLPHKSMNFSFHLCREITEEHMGDPLKTSGAKCITAKEFTISLWTRYLPIAYQEEMYLIVSSSLSGNAGHLKAHKIFLCFSLPCINCCYTYFPFYVSRLLGFYSCSI